MSENTANIGFEKEIWDAACILRGNMDAAAGGNLDEALVHLLEEQIDIAGADFAVAAEIRILLVGDLGADAGDVSPAEPDRRPW